LSAEASGEARSVRHRAQLEGALELASVDGPKHDDAAALKALELLDDEPIDTSVAAGRIARAAILLKRGDAERAATLMEATLVAWAAAQRPVTSAPAASSLEADVAAIRRVVFRPTGDLTFIGAEHWNAFTFPATLPRLVILNPEIQVRSADGTITRHTVYQQFRDIDRVLYLDAEAVALVERLIPTIGGTMRRAPAAVMETPNQPAGASVDILAFWNRYFPARPGHWGGWELETYPIITQIEFLDAERTKASVNVTVGYSGGTVVMEKAGAEWRALRLVNRWIT